jgi:hypothetical protein
MDAAGWMLLGALALVAYGGIAWWRRRSASAAATRTATPAKPRDKRRGPRRIKSSRRESFRMGKDENERRSGQDRRDRKPGWTDDTDKR